ncbi:hypothetical protein JCM10295v2_001878 [Rhodotorula toruloides]
MEIGGGGGSKKADEDPVGLSRSNSRLLSSSGSPPPAGILLNPVSPPLDAMLSPSPIYGPTSSSSASTSNLDLSSSTSTTPGARPSLARTLSDASSSGVSSHVGPTTPSSITFPAPSSAATPTGATTPAATARPAKIRFAPLPEIRPRRYSTGRNVWIVDEEGDDENGPRRTRLVRVGSDLEDGGDEFALDDDDDDDDDDDEVDTQGGKRLMSGKFGSWSETFGAGMWGLSPSTSRRSQDEDARSVTSSVGGDEVRSSASVGSVGSGGSGGSSSKKLLKAFGLKPKSKSKHAAAAAAAAGAGDDDSLTRVSSVESQASRRVSTSNAPRPRGSTGIPMRKYASWEVGEAAQNGPSASTTGPNGAAVAAGGGPVYYASPARSARRRANYPPVAQRSRRPAPNGNSSRGLKVEEPQFEEWGVGGVGSRSKRTSSFSGKEPEEEEDDGSGMAWLRKRRLLREREERERKERQEAEAVGAVQANEPEQQELAQDDTQKPPAPESLPAYLDGVRRRTGSGQMPPRSATIESTTSSASTIRPSTPIAHASPSLNNKPSGLSATRPILSVDVNDQRKGSSSTASPSGSEETPITSPVSIEGDHDVEESESEGEGEEEEDDDDLCAEELAREEALAEAAKRSARSMGAERYHSASHQDELRVLEDRS